MQIFRNCLQRLRAVVLVLLAFALPWLGPTAGLDVAQGGIAWADDGDDGGSSTDSSGSTADGGGADSASDVSAGESTSWSTPSPLRPAPRWIDPGFVADELIAVNPSPAALRRAQRLLGATVIESTQLPRLGVSVLRLRLQGTDPNTALVVLDAHHPGVFALHHLYQLAQGSRPAAPCDGPMCAPKNLLNWPLDSRQCGVGQRLGMVDTAVDTRHPALRGARIQARNWVGNGRPVAQDGHGTAVAALLVGQPGSAFEGLVPQATLLAAHAFFTLPAGEVRADVLGLLRSLEWLVQEGATVIGLSLTGADNPALAQAMGRLQALGVVVVAAAGNGGSSAAPAYPAAYPGVLAATAVTPLARSYRRANRGNYIQFALPGANLTLVSPDGGLGQGSGTSYAVPFLVSLVSQAARDGLINRQDWAHGRGMALRDLGQPGRDATYGWGLPQVPVRCR